MKLRPLLLALASVCAPLLFAATPVSPVKVNSVTGALVIPEVAPVYLHVNHLNSSTAARLAAGVSRDGVNISPVGNPVAYTAPTDEGGDHPRDPIVFYRKSTGYFYALYTHATTNVSPDGYAETLGLCRTRDLAKWEFVAEIPIAGTGFAGGDDFVWSGSVFEDSNGDLYA